VQIIHLLLFACRYIRLHAEEFVYHSLICEIEFLATKNH